MQSHVRAESTRHLSVASPRLLSCSPPLLFIIALLQRRPTGSHSLPNYLHIKRGVAAETQTINSNPPPPHPTPSSPVHCGAIAAATAASNWGCRFKLLTYDFPAIRFTHCQPLANVQHTHTHTLTGSPRQRERDEVSRGRKDRESGDREEHTHRLGLGVVLFFWGDGPLKWSRQGPRRPRRPPGQQKLGPTDKRGSRRVRRSRPTGCNNGVDRRGGCATGGKR